MKQSLRAFIALLAVLHLALAPARAHVLNRTIAAAGGCPQLSRYDTSNPSVKKIDRRWSTSLGNSIITAASTTTARQNEVELAILESFAAWTGVAGTTLVPATLQTPIARTGTQNACNSNDALNSICFNQTDSAFTTNILAFTRVVTSDIVGETFGAKRSAFVGEILDADIYFKPNDTNLRFATPAALASDPTAFDLESVLIHELGHFFGFSHSSVWRAMMWPFAPPRGQFLGNRPTPQVPDGPLSEDDRVGLRVLYPDAGDTVNVGKISGRVLPVNPIALAALPEPSLGRPLTGIFGAQVVAVDADTGDLVAATFAGWSCDPADLPTRFDGTYVLERLPVGRNYRIFAEPLDGPTNSGNISNALNDLCRSGTSNSCTVPSVITNFVTKVRPAGP